MSVPSEALGIHQSDLIIRSAIIAALDDLRANSWLLDYAFASLPKDLLTKDEYGEREIAAARRWFLNTKVNVFMSTMVNEPSFPAISITLMDSIEAETTLGDVHYLPQQDDDRTWPALTEAFTPVSYSQASGEMVLPEAVTLVLAPGQQILDAEGRAHEILEVLDDRKVTIRAGTIADFTGAVIKGRRPSGVVEFESVRHKETYSIGCHVQGEQIHLTYLHTLLTFCLYRYKAELLEARGFERSVISSSDFRRNEAFETEMTFSRHLTLTGYVTQVWPGKVNQKVTATLVQPLRIDESGKLPSDTDPDDVSWIGDEDALTVKF